MPARVSVLSKEGLRLSAGCIGFNKGGVSVSKPIQNFIRHQGWKRNLTSALSAGDAAAEGHALCTTTPETEICVTKKKKKFLQNELPLFQKTNHSTGMT